MSIEITLHPKSASRDELRRLLENLGFSPTTHLWDWPRGSLNFHWFEEKDFVSFDGVEATIFPPSNEEQEKLGPCAWALHTRTRAFAGSADKAKQNTVVRLARAQFGGNFYNDWFGRNRYTHVDASTRDAAARGIYLTYEFVAGNVRAVRFALPAPPQGFGELVGTSFLVRP